MTKTYTSGAVLTIRRPDGSTEEVINTQSARNGVIPAAVFDAMVKATKGAGRGDILSQRPNIKTLTLAEQRAMLAAQAGAGSAFPGSAAWRAARAAESELAAFDAAHPDLLAQTNTERDPGAVSRALRMED